MRRDVRVGVTLALVAVVLSAIALTTDVPDLVIVVLFVVAAVVVHFAFPGGREDD